jgi:NitT/TauT family transport system substrate-binding protein
MKRSTFAVSAASAIAAPALIRGTASAADTVTVGIINGLSDVPFFIANELGYFRDGGIDVAFKIFDSGARMVAPLGNGQLDVAAGSASAGLYNAAARGINIKIVADKGSTPKGYGFFALLVRSDLVKSGKYKNPGDLKGLKVAESAAGISAGPALDRALRKYGLTYSDVQHVYMGFSQQVLALENGSIDASVTAEPSVAQAVQTGAAVRVAGTDEFEPNQEVAVLLYGDRFINQRRDVAERFMVAYLRAIRYFNASLVGGRIRGKNASAIIDMLVKYTPLKNRQVYSDVVAQFNDPNGNVDLATLRSDLMFYRGQGLIEGNVTVDNIYDGSFANAATRRIGRVRRR